MIVIRPIVSSDLIALHKIANDSGHGLTSLPDNKDILERKIEHSMHAFNSNITSKCEQSYLFVMQDMSSGDIVGTSGIEACVGITSPLYHHKLDAITRQSKAHSNRLYSNTLTLCTELSGCTEICSLYLSPAYRKNGNGRALSRFRFLFMVDHPQRFASQIIAEMRGFTDHTGRSPFWEWFQHHYCNIDFATSNQMISAGDMRFIEDSMPKHPIYYDALSESAQQTINRVHPATEPAMALLVKENFTYGKYIGVNDAGPAMISDLQNINSVLESFIKTVHVDDTNIASNKYLASNRKLNEYRAAVIDASVLADTIIISQHTANNLDVSSGDALRLIAQ